MSDSFERAWSVLKMPNMYGDDPRDGNTIEGPLGQGSHADAMRQMPPRLLDALINMRVEEDRRMPTPTPPMHQNPMDKGPREYEPYAPMGPEKPSPYGEKGESPTPMDAKEMGRRMTQDPKGLKPYDGGEPYDGQGEGPKREKIPKNYGDKKGKSFDPKDPAKKPKLGQGLIDRARKNTHTMPGSSKFEKDPKDSKKEE